MPGDAVDDDIWWYGRGRTACFEKFRSRLWPLVRSDGSQKAGRMGGNACVLQAEMQLLLQWIGLLGIIIGPTHDEAAAAKDSCSAGSVLHNKSLGPRRIVVVVAGADALPDHAENSQPPVSC
ncbi:unnamed protein product [Cercospora beticola]|nr:unnamed protein product [Cercospora beticola]